MAAKLNCWEVNACERQPGGAKVGELGVCPASTDASVDGINGGVNGGRICWAVAGTFCGGQVQGPVCRKQRTCMSCDFFARVIDEEGEDLVMVRPGQSSWVGYPAPAKATQPE